MTPSTSGFAPMTERPTAAGREVPVRVCALDAYGTLLDVDAAARRAAEEPGYEALSGRWAQIAKNWRTRQLQYTWLRSLAGEYADFWKITQESLEWALDAEGLAGEAALRSRLLELYWELESFPEVGKTLSQLREAGHALAVLSNGTEKMLEAALRNAGIEGDLDAILSVDKVGVYKPHPRVYAMVGEAFDCEPGSVVFVSSNGWDAAAGRGFGFRAIWANRENIPMERLPWWPEAVVPDLSAVPGAVAAMSVPA